MPAEGTFAEAVIEQAAIVWLEAHRASLPSPVERDFDELAQVVKEIESRRGPHGKRSRKA
jgi:hypothetical protein